MTQAELVESLPERLRRFDIGGPVPVLDDANKLLAYFRAMYYEAVEVGSDTLRLLAEAQSIPAEKAVYCPDCMLVFELKSSGCPACGETPIVLRF